MNGTTIMRNLLFILLTVSCAASVGALEVIELPLPNANRVVIKLMFNNGSMVDPEGKEGLTYTTAKLIEQGGTGSLS